MSKFTLDGHIQIDLGRLIETRCLIQANSGGGKSFLIRKLLEETHGKVQQIVLDMEGEFATLRECFDFILAGKGGDIPADPKTADLLARKILELETSLIVDLYELKKHERIRFVKNFVDALVNAPKELYHPVLVVIDEAHVFVPEKGESEAMSAVVDLATRGRKRGFAAVLATQRLSKLHKDVAAECLNKFIGRTSLDIDRKRAGDELGFISQKDNLALRNLKPGQFYLYGPAISDEVKLIQVGDVKTTHPKAGQRLGHKATKPTAHVKEILKKLVDLPQESATELRDKESMVARIKELERELRGTKKASDPEAEQKFFERGLHAGRKEVASEIARLRHVTKKGYDLAERLQMLFETEGNSEGPAPKAFHAPPASKPLSQASRAPRAEVSLDGRAFGQCERKILGFLLMKEGQSMTKIQVGAMTGYGHGSGGFNNALSNLGQAGLIVRNGPALWLNSSAVEQAKEIVGDHVPHRLEDWIGKLGACERAIYQMLLERSGETFGKEEVAEATNYRAGSGGFNNALSRLNTLGLIKRHPGGQVSLNEEIMNL